MILASTYLFTSESLIDNALFFPFLEYCDVECRWVTFWFYAIACQIVSIVRVLLSFKKGIASLGSYFIFKRSCTLLGRPNFIETWQCHTIRRPTQSINLNLASRIRLWWSWPVCALVSRMMRRLSLTLFFPVHLQKYY